jgi:hypothetical protein
VKVVQSTLLTSDDLATLKKLDGFFMERAEYRGWFSCGFLRGMASFFREAAAAIERRGSLASDERPTTGARLRRRSG